MKHILILGAGGMQKPAVEAAKQLGCHVTAADGNPQACCVPLCDRFSCIDLKDTAALCGLACSMRDGDGIDGVFTAGTDFSAAVAYIAQTLQLPGHSYEAALNASDKIRMRSCFAAAGVPSPRFFCVDRSMCGFSADMLLSAAGFRDALFPLVVKPVDNMGARGCRMVRNPEELMPAVSCAVGYSKTGRAILEEYMDGPEYSIDALVYNGNITITGLAVRHIFYPPYFIEMGHTMPADLSAAQYDALTAVFCAGVKSLGLTCGAAKGDMKFTKKGPMIGEIAARLSGGYMSGWTYPAASGINLTEQAVRIALGMEPSVSLAEKSLPCTKYSAERAWVSVPGVAAGITGLQTAAAVPGVLQVFPRAQAGDTVSFPLNNVEKCGNVITCAGSCADAVAAADAARRQILIRLAPCNKETDLFLAGSLAAEFPPSAFKLPAAVAAEFESWLEKTAEKEEQIPAASLPELPAVLAPYADSLYDWNGRTMRLALEQFASVCAGAKPLPAAAFWKALVRGSIQGLLYVADSTPVKNGL